MSDVLALEQYEPYAGFFDELVETRGTPRPHALPIARFIAEQGGSALVERQQLVDDTIRAMGVSFTVYSDSQNIDRSWPLDVVPRTIPSGLWKRTSDGLKQRLEALNLFINDLYNDQRILKAGVVPASLIHDSKNFLTPCQGITPPHGVWAHICGT